MKVFITWSGNRAKSVAMTLRDWLPSAIHAVEPWMSESDLRAGVRWITELNEQLEQTNFGIIVLTPENLNSPWIHYEAGALAKKVSEASVCPYLVDIDKKIVAGPLAQFQSKLANETETLDLIMAINRRVEGTSQLTETRLKDTFAKVFWPRLEPIINNPSPALPKPAPRSTDELLAEMLERIRSLEKSSVGFELLAKVLEEIRSLERPSVGLASNARYQHVELPKITTESLLNRK